MLEDTIRRLAVAAHACWCNEMCDAGWRPGPFSAANRTHDALVDFDDLEVADQRRTLRSLRFDGTAEYLAELLDYPREGTPELQPEDMRMGRRVALVPEEGMDDLPTNATQGQVVSWSINPATGDLDLVRVRWDDGSESEHTPNERELTLADDRPPPRSTLSL